jgi:peptidoglycan biosynthesis protein MviN/MurJ (putative lipid II flippase)
MKQGLLFGLSVANVLLSAGLQFVPLVFFGAGLTVDTFVAALMVPSVLTSISAVVVTYALVPQFAGLDASAQGGLARRAFFSVSAFLGVPMIVLIVFAWLWVPWTVPGFAAEEMTATVDLARVSLASSLVGAYALVLSARMQANSEFVLNALAAALSAGVAAGVAVVAIGQFGIMAAAWSLVLKSGLQLVLTWMLDPPRLGEQSTRKLVLGRTAAPLLASSSISKLEPLVDRSLLTSAPPGLLTLFYLAQQIYGALSQVAAGSLLAHVLPRFSTQARERGGGPPWQSLTRELRRAALVAVAFWILLAGAVLLGALSIGRLCPSCMSLMTGSEFRELGVLMAALGGVWFFGLQGTVLASFFYAQGDTMTPSVVAVAGFVAAVGIKVAGFSLGGAVGLAVANSLYFFSTSAGMFALLLFRHRAKRHA